MAPHLRERDTVAQAWVSALPATRATSIAGDRDRKALRLNPLGLPGGAVQLERGTPSAGTQLRGLQAQKAPQGSPNGLGGSEQRSTLVGSITHLEDAQNHRPPEVQVLALPLTRCRTPGRVISLLEAELQYWSVTGNGIFGCSGQSQELRALVDM